MNVMSRDLKRLTACLVCHEHTHSHSGFLLTGLFVLLWWFCHWMVSVPLTWRKEKLSYPTSTNWVRNINLYITQKHNTYTQTWGHVMCQRSVWQWWVFDWTTLTQTLSSLSVYCVVMWLCFSVVRCCVLCRIMWNSLPSYETHVPIQNLPKSLHTSYGTTHTHVHAWTVGCVVCHCLLFFLRVCIPSLMGLWVTPCMTPCSKLISNWEAEKNSTIAGGVDSLWVLTPPTHSSQPITTALLTYLHNEGTFTWKP